MRCLVVPQERLEFKKLYLHEYYLDTIYLLVKKFFPHIATRFRVNQNDKMLIRHNDYKLIRKKYIDIGTFPSILVTHIDLMD